MPHQLHVVQPIERDVALLWNRYIDFGKTLADFKRILNSHSLIFTADGQAQPRYSALIQ